MSISISRHTSSQSEVAPFLANRIITQLNAGKKVLWLLSGGSGITVGVETSKLLASHNLSNLFISISDERYGAPGHANENMQQLHDAGFSAPDATIYRPLTGATAEKATAAYNDWLTTAFQDTEYRIVLLGIGDDGHTSGVKPHSPAVYSKDAACYFVGEDYERITTTPQYLSRFDEAVVQAYGENKHDVVRTLILRPSITLDDFPAGLIWTIPNVTLYTNYKEELK